MRLSSASVVLSTPAVLKNVYKDQHRTATKTAVLAKESDIASDDGNSAEGRFWCLVWGSKHGVDISNAGNDIQA